MLLRPSTALRLHRYPRRLAVTSPPSLSSSAAAPAAAGEMAAISAVEHVVLFKVRQGTEAAKVAAMASNLRSLSSLDGVLHLHAGPVLRHRSAAASSFGFDHLLYSRYRSKDDLASYSAHPAHVSVVRDFVLPICDDVMAVDWIAQLGADPEPPLPGSAARVSLMKLAESAGEEGKRSVLDALREVPGSVSYGENFSPGRAKGFSLGSIAFFSGVEELDAAVGKADELMEARKEKVRPLLDGLIVLDFVFAPQTSPSSGL
ncbi:stress-response A/B barrel domain-containing protein UP3-like [Wolffia australiana]